ncbi:DUF624 domain-containing protein [Paenibacillus nanensis]|uniref:DUF624 domain-containing protein n=1 Tax=Paenibacillus nanensis TaxID=393251 RepID=A0A3A1V052_9BACL|nr:DUF624 domain-containing protein [Paenibacillus nanensis]RIX54067.1 DUF624 domain-containing protein [Paenibacillus nanensis]
MEPRGLMGGFYRISEWIMRLAVINLLWVVCSLPVIFILFTALFGLNPEDVETYGILPLLTLPAIVVAVLTPFLVFPATAAMFTVARKWVTGEADVPLFKTFFRGYKENYKQSMIGGILYTVLFALLVVNFFFYREEFSVISYIFLAFLVLVAASLFNFFSMLVHYHMKTFQLIKNALLITIGKPFRSLSNIIMIALVIVISWNFMKGFMFMFFTGSIIAFVSFWNFNIIYMKLQEQAEKMKQSEEEAAEEAAEMDREELVKDDYKDSNK